MGQEESVVKETEEWGERKEVNLESLVLAWLQGVGIHSRYLSAVREPEEAVDPRRTVGGRGSHGNSTSAVATQA